MRMTAMLLAAAVMLPLPAMADSVLDQLDNARKAYEAGDVSGAVTELEFAIQELKGKVGEFYRQTFPPAPAGWTFKDNAEAGAGMAGMMGGTVIARTYTDPAGGQMEVQIMTGGGMMQGLAQMFMNPQFMQTQPNAKRVRLGRETAVVTFDPAQRGGQLMMDISGKVTISIEGSNLANGDVMSDFAGKWDFKKLREIAGL